MYYVRICICVERWPLIKCTLLSFTNYLLLMANILSKFNNSKKGLTHIYTHKTQEITFDKFCKDESNFAGAFATPSCNFFFRFLNILTEISVSLTNSVDNSFSRCVLTHKKELTCCTEQFVLIGVCLLPRSITHARHV